MVLVLPSCQIPKLRQSQTGSAIPATYNGAATPDNSALLRVDEFYDDQNIHRLVCQAMANNRDLKVLEEEIEVARSAILARRGAYLPLVGFRGSAGWDRNSKFTPTGAAEKELEYRPGRHFPATPGDYLTGFNFYLPVDIWRELRNARDAARQRYLAAVERRNDFVTRMVADIADSYYTLMSLDKRIQTLDRNIELQQSSYEIAKARFEAGRGNELAVQRFLAEVRRNQSEKLVVRQDIIEAENRINLLAGRLPQPVARSTTDFFEVTLRALSAGVPAQLLLNRPDIRQAERELEAAGLEVKVARAHFFPRIDISGTVGYQAFNPKYLFNPEALLLNAAGDLTAPVINKAAIRADYLAANARQLEAVYSYQRVILGAFTEVINRLAMVENYTRSIEVRRRQLTALENSVDLANQLFQAARIEYIEVLFAQRDLLEARTVLIDTKRRQLSAVVNAYQALGGGALASCPAPERPVGAPGEQPDPRPKMNPPEAPRLLGAATAAAALPAPTAPAEPLAPCNSKGAGVPLVVPAVSKPGPPGQ
ncbi:MAG: TolC family protein [Gemmata sp.]